MTKGMTKNMQRKIYRRKRDTEVCQAINKKG